MKNLSPLAQEWLDRGRDEFGPPPGAKARVRAGLEQAAAGPPSDVVREVEAAGAGSGLGFSVVAGTAVLGALLAVGWDAAQPPVDIEAPPSVPPQHAPRFTEVKYEAPTPPPVEGPRAKPSVRVAAVVMAPAVEINAPEIEAPSPAPSEPEAHDLAAEAKLLAKARAALRDGRAHEALTLVKTHAERFPEGLLRPERWAAEAMAACASGDEERARHAAGALADHAPDSPHLARISARCRP